MRQKISLSFIIGSILFFALLIVWPYFKSGYFPTHDGEWAVVRLGDMYRSVKDLQIPVRYSGHLNFGYGYPLFNFAYPMPYYLGIATYLLTSGLVNSIKVLFVLSVMISGVGMYMLATRIWQSRLAGFVSAVMYLYYPYRMVDLYVRGSLGESLSLMLFPFLFLFSYLIVTHKKKETWSMAGAVTYAMLIMTHNIMTVLFTPLLIGYVLFLQKKHKFQDWRYFLILFSGGLGLSAFFWLPALIEKHMIRLATTPIADRSLYFVTPLQLLQPKFGYGVPTDTGGFGYFLGFSHLLTVLIAILFLLFQTAKKHIPQQLMNLHTFFLISTIVLILLLFRPTEFLWQAVPLLREINYPWTLLAPIGFLISLSAGYTAIIPRYRILSVMLLFIAVVTVLPYARPSVHSEKSDEFYLTNEATTTSSDELLPLWVKKQPTEHFDQKVVLLSGAGNINDVLTKSNMITFQTNLSRESMIRVNTIYYPGWKAVANKTSLPIIYDNDMGVMDLSLPAGNHAVEIHFTETPIRLAADIVSLMSVCILFLYILISVWRSGKVYMQK
jgi:hypothetical protein